MGCAAPEAEAPDLMTFDKREEVGYHCYFKKQPGTPEELERAIMAIRVGCCAGVRYAGTDGRIVRRLVESDVADTCDILEN
jgi:hypothetical protein